MPRGKRPSLRQTTRASTQAATRASTRAAEVQRRNRRPPRNEERRGNREEGAVSSLSVNSMEDLLQLFRAQVHEEMLSQQPQLPQTTRSAVPAESPSTTSGRVTGAQASTTTTQAAQTRRQQRNRRPPRRGVVWGDEQANTDEGASPPITANSMEDFLRLVRAQIREEILANQPLASQPTDGIAPSSGNSVPPGTIPAASGSHLTSDSSHHMGPSTAMSSG